jgi:hypothetical protein
MGCSRGGVKIKRGVDLSMLYGTGGPLKINVGGTPIPGRKNKRGKVRKSSNATSLTPARFNPAKIKGEKVRTLPL